MAEEKGRFFLLQPRPHAIEPGAFTLDLYRLVCMVLASRQVANHERIDRRIHTLQKTYLRAEVTRILTSCAIVLRIQLERYVRRKESAIERLDCGKLFPNWKTNRKKGEVLYLREACNEIIHATDVRFGVMNPNAVMKSAYLRPYLFLYGRKGRDDWRAVLSLIDFAKYGSAFLNDPRL